MSFRSYFYLTLLIWLPSLVYICIIKHNEFWIVRITRDKKIIGEGIWKMFFLGNEMKDGVLATEMKKSLDQWWGHTLNELPFFFPNCLPHQSWGWFIGELHKYTSGTVDSKFIIQLNLDLIDNNLIQIQGKKYIF